MKCRQRPIKLEHDSSQMRVRIACARDYLADALRVQQTISASHVDSAFSIRLNQESSGQSQRTILSRLGSNIATGELDLINLTFVHFSKAFKTIMMMRRFLLQELH